MFSETKTKETLLKQIFSVLENFTIDLFRTNHIQTYMYIYTRTLNIFVPGICWHSEIRRPKIKQR